MRPRLGSAAGQATERICQGGASKLGTTHSGYRRLAQAESSQELRSPLLAFFCFLVLPKLSVPPFSLDESVPDNSSDRGGCSQLRSQSRASSAEAKRVDSGDSTSETPSLGETRYLGGWLVCVVVENRWCRWFPEFEIQKYVWSLGAPKNKEKVTRKETSE